MSRLRLKRRFLEPRVQRQEETHRRVALLGVAMLIVLTAAPVFGHHVAAGADSLLEGRDHLGAMCLIALHHVLEPVHGGFHVVVLAGFAFALLDRLRAWWRLRAVLQPLAWEPARPGDSFWGAAEAAWLDPRRLRLVAGLPNPAFTAGLLRPVVYVAKSLPERLHHDELVAVLAHEAVHLKRRDPLRLSAMRFLARMLFWLPALGRLADDIADQAELEADDIAAGDRPLTLASALLAIASGPHEQPLPEAAVGAWATGRGNLLERRIRRLAGEPTPIRSHVTLRSIWLAAAALAVLFASNVAVVHPLPQPGVVQEHCMHHQGNPFSHLFCRHGAVGDECPHMAARPT